jgi:glycosyltransferase involved in cell wall biosynthesis
MKIGIDGHFVTRLPRRGIGTYALNLIHAITAAFPNEDFYIYIRHPDFENILPNLPNVKVRLIKSFADPVWEQVLLPLAISRDQLDVFHSLGNTGPIVMPGKVRHVLSLMDVMFLQGNTLMPTPTNFYQMLGRFYRSIIAPRVAKKSAAVITISDFSKKDILTMIDAVPEEKISVVYLDCDHAFKDHSQPVKAESEILKSFGLGESFILCLGADDPRKNTLAIIQAFVELNKNHKINEDLVIVGYKNWESSACYQEVLLANIADKVHFLPFVSTIDLFVLYRKAKFFLYPSLYEGFGIPLLEAFNVGCPVIASDTSSIPEVGGDSPLYISPERLDDLIAAMLTLLSDDRLISIMRKRGLARAKNFSWEKTAMETMCVYRQSIAIVQA